jgi:hypothetical protein
MRDQPTTATTVSLVVVANVPSDGTYNGMATNGEPDQSTVLEPVVVSLPQRKRVIFKGMYDF